MRPPGFASFVMAFVVCAGASAAVLEPRDDEVSIVAALAQAQSGDTVQLPSGTIELTEPLRMRSRVTLLGRGQDSQANASSAPILAVTVRAEIECSFFVRRIANPSYIPKSHS